MKKLSYILFSLVTLFLLSTTTFAEYSPKGISFDTSTSTYLGGSTYPVRIQAVEDGQPGSRMVHEVGVAQELINGRITQFKILSAQTVSAAELVQSQFVQNIKLPNLNLVSGAKKASATTTYVLYVKSYFPNDPDSENLFISKSFTIKPTSKPSAELVNGGILLNTGESYTFSAGPTIYKTAITKAHATSSQLMLTIDSNATSTVTPRIVFSKLRSNSLTQEVVGKTLSLRPGRNAFTIDLPTFDYVPGVYIGKLHLQPDTDIDLIKEIEFKYIIDGPSVTVGQMVFVSQQKGAYVFNLPTFGKPADILTPGINASTTSTTTAAEIYNTTFTFIDSKGRVLTTVTEAIDYTKTTPYALTVAGSKVKHAAKVVIKTTDGQNVFFETTQDLTMPKPTRSKEHAMYAGCIILLGIAWFLVSRRKRILVWTVLMAAIFISAYVWAANWSPYPTRTRFFDGNHMVYATFNQNFSTEPVSCGVDGTDVLVKLSITTCENSIDRIYVGMSRTSMAEAKSVRTQVSYLNNEPIVLSKTLVPTKHKVWTYALNWIKIGNIKGPVAAGSKLYVHLGIDVYEVGDCITRVSDHCVGYAEYEVPLFTTPATGYGACDRCTNIGGVQTTPNFAAHGRDYFFSTVDSKLYFAAAAAVGSATTPEACTVDMCGDTSAVESPTVPVGYVWNSAGSTDYEKYSCIPEPTETCACSGRTRTCVSGGVTVSTTNNAPQCSLSATCSYPTPVSGNQVTFTFSATNILGTLGNGGNSVQTIPSTGSGTISETRTLTNTGDGQTATASCSYSYTNEPGGGSTTTPPCVVGDPLCPSTPPCTPGVDCPAPTIESFNASKIVKQGDFCEFSWVTHNFDSCTLSGESVGRDEGSASFPTSEGKNVRKKLTCTVGGTSPQTVSETRTCLVRPKSEEF